MLLEDHHVHAGAGEEHAEHHAGRAPARDAAGNAEGRRGHDYMKLAGLGVCCRVACCGGHEARLRLGMMSRLVERRQPGPIASRWQPGT